MKGNTKRWLAGLGTVTSGLFLVWLGGFNFDERGAHVVYGAIVIGWCAAAAVIIPEWHDS